MSRDRPAELPFHVPMQSNAVAAAKNQRYSDRRDRNAHFAVLVAAIAGFDMFNLLPRLRATNTPQLLGRSQRQADLIVAQLRDFYAQRPRPWISPNARARALRGADRHRIVYDRQARREARCP